MDQHRTTLRASLGHTEYKPMTVPAGLCLSRGDTFTVEDQAKCMLAMALSAGAGLKKVDDPPRGPGLRKA